MTTEQLNIGIKYMNELHDLRVDKKNLDAYISNGDNHLEGLVKMAIHLNDIGTINGINEYLKKVLKTKINSQEISLLDKIKGILPGN